MVRGFTIIQQGAIRIPTLIYSMNLNKRDSALTIVKKNGFYPVRNKFSPGKIQIAYFIVRNVVKLKF